MLAEYDIHPAQNPPGFTYIAGEPEFDAALHLQLEAPERTWSLGDFGYDEKAAAQYPSNVALLSPIRILSDAGIDAMQVVIDLCRAREMRAPGQAGRLMFPTYHSKFLRDLHNSPELTAFLSRHFETPIGPHPMPQMHQINYSHDEAGKVIVPWHHDQIGFTMVLSMYDPEAVKGGRFEWFWGTREEGQALLDQNANGSLGDLPANRTTSPKCQPGVACFMQGSAIMHRGAPLEEPGYRASVVFSYVTRDASFPDANRSYFTTGWETGMGVTEGMVQPKATEWARHKAWFAQARLGTLIEELPFTDDRGAIARQLRAAIAPVMTAIERLEAEPEAFQFGKGRRPELYYKDDEVQNTEERFLPGKLS